MQLQNLPGRIRAVAIEVFKLAKWIILGDSRWVRIIQICKPCHIYHDKVDQR